ncbi:hypothetical protein [uncultured Croceitalea sp.]|uniref:hypothetical protein n=1 Tax=uncultured Croceitalea sp. TaxID=1798908 RepID=UPI003306428E
MKTISLLALFFTLNLLFINAQDSVDIPSSLGSSYGTYFELPRESIYLHLNKDKYVKGESLWFKGYVYNRKSHKPFVTTTNVYLGIYDSLGLQKSKYLYYAEDGYFNGNITIDSTFTDGNYYVKASTNWMRNFKEDDSYVQQIEVLSKTYKSPRANTAVAYDVQLLPEGGNVVGGLPNVVGVQILDRNGFGGAVKTMKLHDASGKQLVTFSTNQFGLGKFEFIPSLNNSYTVSFTSVAGDKVNTKLPIAYSKGINLRLQNNPFYDKVILNITGNVESSGKDFKLMIHKDGNYKEYPIEINGETNNAVFVLQKKELPHGVNTVTVFDSNDKPVLERLFFNNTKKDVEELSVRILSTEEDSIVVGIRSKENTAMLNLSVSVLPESTISYGHQENIKSMFYLRPYLRGYIERPNYYFTSTTPKKEYELDLLLLTQGWSRYRWFDVVNNKPNVNYEFEDGVTLSVNLNNKDAFGDGDKLMIHKSEYHGSQIIPIKQEDNSIDVTNFFPQNGERLYFSLSDKNDKIEKIGAYFTLGNYKINDRLSNLNQYFRATDLETSVDLKNSNSFDLIQDKETIALENVTVFEDKVERLADKNILIPTYLKGKVTEIDIDLARTFPLMTDLIRAKGYEVIEIALGMVIRSRRGGGVNLVFDNVRQPNLDILYRLRSNQVESFFFDRLSRYEGAMSQNQETFYIYTRKGKELNVSPGIENFKASNATSYLVENGFEESKEFYSPAYTTYLDEAFENFGVIHWEPNLEVNKNGEATFKILNTQNNYISFFFEGMGNNGYLLSKVDKIDISEISKTK